MAQGNYGTPNNRVNIVAERWQYTPHTSDPASTEKGDEWLRVDMDSGDRIATLRFKHGTGSGDVWGFPVFPTSETPENQIKKKWRFDTTNGEGFVPLYEQGGVYQQRAFQINGTRHGVHNSLTEFPNYGVSRYPLDGDATDTWDNNDGAVNGTTFVSDPQQGTVASFSDMNDNIAFGSPILPNADEFSISAMVNPSSLSENQHPIYTEEPPSDSDARNHIYINNSGEVVLDQFPPSGGSLVSSTALSSGTWYRIVVTSSTANSSQRIYINGLEDTSATSTEEYNGNSVTQAHLGRRVNADSSDQLQYFGLMKDVRLFDGRLPPSEATAPSIVGDNP